MDCHLYRSVSGYCNWLIILKLCKLSVLFPFSDTIIQHGFSLLLYGGFVSSVQGSIDCARSLLSHTDSLRRLTQAAVLLTYISDFGVPAEVGSEILHFSQSV
jgi:hypothetical protein